MTPANDLLSAIRRPHSSRLRRARGFTLIEAALTTVIIGTGVLAIVAAQQAYTRKNDWAQRSGTAMLLANEIREMTLPLPIHDPITGSANLGPETNETGGATVTDPELLGQYAANFDDLDDFAGVQDTGGEWSGITFDPPINALAQTVSGMTGWSQHVKVENVLPTNISSTYTQPLGSTDLYRVTVEVYYQSPQDATPMKLTELVWVTGK
ncbi:MAG: hypothetical protein GC164_15915 [Phycisphaera sp.]|nr:hypothetical protein [Phycisphaera sp.]